MTSLRACFLTRGQLMVLLSAVFAANFLETQLEELFKTPASYALGYRINQALLEMEGGFEFGPTDRVRLWVAGGYSFSYFFLFPLLIFGSVMAFWRAERIQPLRVFSFSVALNYLLALPFFLFLPVPERWAFPGANATLLSDRLSTRLIEGIRPISGLDNCFPSMHVALTVLVILLGYWCRVRWRHSLLCLGGTVILSTFFLGIHWVVDIVVGAASAAVSFALAVALNRRLFPAEPHRAFFFSDSSTPPMDLPVRQDTGKTVFISYRRERGSSLARIVQTELERRGFPCFLDVDDLGAEHFDERLLREIELAPNTVVVLAPGSLDRCHTPDDWLRREIVHALKTGRNVIPFLADGFQFPAEKDMPEGLQDLYRLNGVVYSHQYFTASFDKLQGFLKDPRKEDKRTTPILKPTRP